MLLLRNTKARCTQSLFVWPRSSATACELPVDDDDWKDDLSDYTESVALTNRELFPAEKAAMDGNPPFLTACIHRTYVSAMPLPYAAVVLLRFGAALLIKYCAAKKISYGHRQDG